MYGLAASTIGRIACALSGLHFLITSCVQLAHLSTILEKEEKNKSKI